MLRSRMFFWLYNRKDTISFSEILVISSALILFRCYFKGFFFIQTLGFDPSLYFSISDYIDAFSFGILTTLAALYFGFVFSFVVVDFYRCFSRKVSKRIIIIKTTLVLICLTGAYFLDATKSFPIKLIIYPSICILLATILLMRFPSLDHKLYYIFIVFIFILSTTTQNQFFIDRIDEYGNCHQVIFKSDSTPQNLTIYVSSSSYILGRTQDTKALIAIPKTAIKKIIRVQPTYAISKRRKHDRNERIRKIIADTTQSTRNFFTQFSIFLPSNWYAKQS